MSQKINTKAVGQRIKNIRQSMGLSQEAFGEKIDSANKSLISRWERGENLPNNERIKLIAYFGDISVDQLLHGEIADNARRSKNAYLLDNANAHIETYNKIFKSDFNLLKDSAIEQLKNPFSFLQDSSKSPAVKKYNHERNTLKEVEEKVKQYLSTTDDCTYDEYLTKYPDANLDDFQNMKNKEWQKLKREIDLFIEASNLVFEGDLDSIFRTRFLKLIDSDSFLLKLEQAKENNMETEFLNETIQPILNQAVKDINNISNE